MYICIGVCIYVYSGVYMYIYVYCDILLTREIRITTPTTPLTHNPNTPYIGMFNHKDTLVHVHSGGCGCIQPRL